MVATSFNGNSNSVVGWSKVIKKVERARGIDEAAVNPDWRLSYARVFSPSTSLLGRFSHPPTRGDELDASPRPDARLPSKLARQRRMKLARNFPSPVSVRGV